MKNSCRHRGLVAIAIGILSTVLPLGCGGGKSASKTRTAAIESQPESSSERQSDIRFTDVTAQTRIEFTPQNGERAGHFAILESLGTGVALFDFDGDGSLDVFLPGGGGYGPGPQVVGRAAALYRNRDDFRFEDVTGNARLSATVGYSHGSYVADYDNDGFPDILVTGYHGIVLYHNCGDGTFENVTRASGLVDKRWSTGAAWADVNGDGNLDLYVVHYVDWSFDKHPVCRGFGGKRDVCSPNDFDALDDVLFLASGEGTFHNSTKPAGLVAGGKGLAVIAGDFDHDGKPDFYVANDTTPNFLYQNKGAGTFNETGVLNGAGLNTLASADGSMGLELADLNLDGRPDLWVTNFEHQSFALYRNEGRFAFQHVSARMGISAIGRTHVGFGTVAADFDSDGDEDLAIANGHVMMHSRNSPLKQRPLLFENIAGDRFENVAGTAGAYFQRRHRGRGIACGDLDGDGRIDIVITHIDSPVSVLQNASRATASQLEIRLVGIRSSRHAVGATVELIGSSKKQVRFVKSGASYLSTSDSLLTFRLKDGGGPVQINVTWPGGESTKHTLPSSGKYVVFQSGIPLRIRR